MWLNIIFYFYFLNNNLSYYYSPYDLKYYENKFYCVGYVWLVSDTGASSAAGVICFFVHYLGEFRHERLKVMFQIDSQPQSSPNLLAGILRTRKKLAKIFL